MAKKPLTPEQAEIKAMKKAKSSENWTKFWAVLLAAVLTVSVVFMGKTAAEDAISRATGSESTEEGGESSNNGGSDSSDPFGGSSNSDPFGGSSNSDPFGGSSSTTPDAGTSTTPDAGTSTTPDAGTSTTPDAGTQTTPDAGTQTKPDAGTQTKPDAGTNTTPDAGTQTKPDAGTNNDTSSNNGAATQATAADVAKAINDATAKAAKASYDWSREAKFTRNIDVGGLTGILDGIIKGVDENASLNSVVGGFLGIKEQPFAASVTNGQLPESGMEEKYLLKAMTLTEGDIQQFRVNGNTYMVQIKDCTNPDANSAWAHASNDYITYSEVNSSIAGALGSEGKVTVVENQSQANYKNIILTAVIENGQLTSLEYKYTFDANLTIKAGISAKGSGAAAMQAKYTNFQY